MLRSRSKSRLVPYLNPANAPGDHSMTEFEQYPPEVAIYNKAIRMFLAGISQSEFARLDPDGSVWLKLHDVDKWGSYQHSTDTVRPGEAGYERISREHALTNPGDNNVIERRLIDGEWRTLTVSPKYRWAMLRENGELLVKLDADSEQRFAAGTAEHADLCQQHNLSKSGDNSVVELE